MDSDTIAQILAVDIPADKKLEILAILNARPERSKAAERMRRYRANRHACVTGDVTRYATEVTPPSPSLAPSPLSPLHPPIPAPPHPPTPGDIREAQARERPEPQFRFSQQPHLLPNPAIPEAVAIPLRALFSRREATAWTAKEIAAFRKLKLSEPELVANLETFAKARRSGWEYYRRDTLTLLNNWQAETERCEDFLRTAEPKAAPAAAIANKYGPVQLDRWAQPAIS